MVELYDRLSTAAEAGNALEIVQQVRIGSIEEARLQTNLPIVNIQLKGGNEDAAHMNRHNEDAMSFEISLVHTKLAGTLNTLYKTSDSTGALFLFEKMLNSIDNDTSGSADNTWGATIKNLNSTSYQVFEDADVIVFIARIEVTGKSIVLGGR